MAWIKATFYRLIKCRACGELVPDAKYCIECGYQLKKED